MREYYRIKPEEEKAKLAEEKRNERKSESKYVAQKRIDKVNEAQKDARYNSKVPTSKQRLGILKNQADLKPEDHPESFVSQSLNLFDSTPCEKCHAYTFPNEPKGFCCNNGTISLPLPTVPDFLRELLQKNKKFRDNLRKYNNACALTSLGFDEEVKMPGFNPNLKICGRCYHRIGSLTADAGEQRKFA